MKTKYLMSALATIILIAGTAFGQNPTVVVGKGLVVSNSELANQTSPFNFRVSLTAGRSYCCSILTSESAAFINSISDVLNGTQLSFKLRGNLHPDLLISGLSTATSARACLLTSNGTTAVVSANFGAPNGTDTVGLVRAECEQTTLFGGYNTSAAELNFLEITNRTLADVAVRVVGTNEFEPSSGFSQSFTLVGGRRFDMALHELVPAGAFGSIVVSHDATTGSVGVAVSQYRVENTSPLRFQLVGRIPFETQK